MRSGPGVCIPIDVSIELEQREGIRGIILRPEQL